MKTSNKQSFFHLLLAFCFMLQFVVTAPVAKADIITTGSITVQFPTGTSATANTEFKLYQIFDGDYTDGVMNYDTLNADLYTYFDDISDIPTTSSTTAPSTYEADVIEYIEGMETYSDKAELLAKEMGEELANASALQTRTIQTNDDRTTFGPLNYGYYLIISDSYPAMLVNITEIDIFGDGANNTMRTVILKSSLPTMHKEIYHNEEAEWDEVGDNQIGDQVDFKITLKLPDADSVSKYDTSTPYQYKLVDVMDMEQFEFTQGTLVVTTQDFTNLPTGLEEKLDITDHYTFNTTQVVDFSATNTGFVIDFDVAAIFNDNNLQEFNGMHLYVYFTAKLLDSANVMGNVDTANLNTANLYYSIEATDAWDGTFEQDHIDKLDPTDNNQDSEYEDKYDSSGDTVSDYTFKLEGSKVDKNNAPLADVVFGLYDNGTVVYLEETSTGSTIYFPSTGTQGTGADANNADGFILTDGTGFFTIIGLDDARNYTLKEESAPDGYETVDDILFTLETKAYSGQTFDPSLILNDHSGGTLNYSSDNLVDFEVETANGKYIDATIKNLKNTLLPETGGMGTVLFQVVGAGMMAGAAILLYLKRKNA